MRPLNRPMFKTGGPIKEGIMSGMQDRPGYSAAGRVGSFFLNTIPKIFKSQPSVVGSGKGIPGKYVPAPLTTMEKIKQFFQTAPAGKFAAGTTEGKLIGNIIAGSGVVPRVIKGTAKTAAKSPLITGGILYYGGGALLPDGTPDPNDPKNYKPAGERGKSGAPGGGDPDMFLTPQGKKEGEGTPTLTENEQREALKKKYYDIMEIDKLTKRATGDALIAASQDLANLNREGITLKEGLRSGDLQSRLISSVSKAFDKPDKTKDAIDAAILKAEITKDINREKDDLDRRVKESTLAVRKKQLEGDTFEEAVAEATIKENAPKGRDLAVLFKVKTGNDATVIDSTKVPQGVDEEVFLKEQIEVARKEGTPTPPGYYVISDSIFIIDAQGNISRRL